VQEIFRAREHGKAEVLKAALEANGITAVIRGDFTLGIVGGYLSVWVASDRDVSKAKSVLEELETQGPVKEYA